MARRRRGGGLSSLMEGFNAGYDTTGKVIQDYQLAKVADMKPEDTGYSKPGTETNAPDQNQYAYDSDTGTYVPRTMDAGGQEIPAEQRAPGLETATPQFAPGEKVNQWRMGDRTFAEKPTDQQVDTERTRAQADVLQRMGNLKEADALRANAVSREAAGLSLDRAKRENDTEAAGRAAFDASPTGIATSQYQQAVKAYTQAGGKNPDGTPMQPPVMPTLSPADHLQTALSVASATKNLDLMVKADQMAKQLKNENWGRTMLAADNGASPEDVARLFNESGTKIDPATVSIRRVPFEIAPGRVVKTSEVTYTDPQTGKVQTFNARRELDALGMADKITKNFFESEKLRVLEQNASSKQQNADTRSEDQIAKEMGLYGRGAAAGKGAGAAGGGFKKEVYDRIDESLSNAAGALPAEKQAPLGAWMRDPNNPMAQSKFHVNPTAQAVAVALAKSSPDLADNSGALANVTAEVLSKPRTVDRWTGQEAVDYDGQTIPIPGARKMAVPPVVQKIAGDPRRDAIVAKVTEALNSDDAPTLRKWSAALGVSNAQLLDLANHFQAPAEFSRVPAPPARAVPTPAPARVSQGRITPVAGLR